MKIDTYREISTSLLGGYRERMIAIWWDGTPVGDYRPLAAYLNNRDEQGLAAALARLEDQKRQYIEERINILRLLTSTWPKNCLRQLLSRIGRDPRHERFK